VRYCRICGRRLTDAESVERGIGPVCAGRLGLIRRIVPANRRDELNQKRQLRLDFEGVENGKTEN
jgi:hypothetical protein